MCSADRVCGDVVAGIVTKCLNARAKTKESAIAVCLMYIETEKQEVVQVCVWQWLCLIVFCKVRDRKHFVVLHIGGDYERLH